MRGRRREGKTEEGRGVEGEGGGEEGEKEGRRGVWKGREKGRQYEVTTCHN